MSHLHLVLLNLRSSVLGTEGGGVLAGWRVHAVALVHLVPQVLVDGAGLVAHFDLPQSWHAEEKVLVVDEALILRQALAVVPHLPVHPVEEGPLCELQVDFLLKTFLLLFLNSRTVDSTTSRDAAANSDSTFQKSSMVERLLKVAGSPGDSGVSRKS